nr:Chain B, Trypsin inhibitor 2 [synthetic construct]
GCQSNHILKHNRCKQDSDCLAGCVCGPNGFCG